MRAEGPATREPVAFDDDAGMRARLAASHVAIVGCRGLGSNAAAMLVRSGIVPSCNRPSEGSHCNFHRMRVLRHGDPMADIPIRRYVRGRAPGCPASYVKFPGGDETYAARSSATRRPGRGLRSVTGRIVPGACLLLAEARILSCIRSFAKGGIDR